MVYYRLYFLANNKIRGFEELHAPDDAAAVEMAHGFADGSAMELWSQDRRVHLFAAFQPAGAPEKMAPADSGSRRQEA